jgi:hypothetical protein
VRETFLFATFWEDTMALLDNERHSGRSIYSSQDTLEVVSFCIGFLALILLAAGAF